MDGGMDGRWTLGGRWVDGRWTLGGRWVDAGWTLCGRYPKILERDGHGRLTGWSRKVDGMVTGSGR